MSARWHPSDRQRSNRDGVFGRPRQRQTRREAGTQSYGLLTVRGGTDKAARLPKGWTGPESMLGLPGIRKDARIFFCARFGTLTKWKKFRKQASPRGARALAPLPE